MRRSPRSPLTLVQLAHTLRTTADAIDQLLALMPAAVADTAATANAIATSFDTAFARPTRSTKPRQTKSAKPERRPLSAAARARIGRGIRAAWRQRRTKLSLAAGA